jgi:hypothetical protein
MGIKKSTGLEHCCSHGLDPRPTTGWRPPNARRCNSARTRTPQRATIGFEQEERCVLAMEPMASKLSGPVTIELALGAFERP